MPPRVILLNRTDPAHAGCKLTCQVLMGLIAKYGELTGSYPTPEAKPDNQQEVDFSRADVVLINGEGTMHHHSAAHPRHSAQELHRQAMLAKSRGLRVALVNTVIEAFEQDLSLYDYLSTRESLSQAAARSHPSPVLVPDMCFYHLLRTPPPMRTRQVVVTDSVYPEISAHLKAWARARNYTYVSFSKITYRSALELFRRSRLVITGRYHGAVFSLMTHTPMHCLGSNTHKITGLANDFGVQGNMLDTLAEIESRLPQTPAVSSRDLAALPDEIEASVRQAILGDSPGGIRSVPASAGARGRVTTNVRRLFTPRSMRHMLQFPRGFIRPLACYPGYREIWWQGEAVGRLRPLAPLRNSTSADGFIVASGPSIAPLDLRPLKDRACFAVNGSIHKFRELGFSPRYYVVVDKDFSQHRLEQIREATTAGATCFFRSDILPSICRQDVTVLGGAKLYLIESVNHAYGRPALDDSELRSRFDTDPDILLHPTVLHDPSKIGFSMDLDKGSFHSMTVVHAALQAAFYLGMQRVFILGMDLQSSPEKARFYESGAGARPTHVNDDFESHLKPSMELVREMGKRRRFEVYNVSPESRLPAEILPKISYEEARAMFER